MKRRLSLLLGLTILLRIELFGQLDRYWDVNVNAESALMGGATVAGQGDIGSAFYNPAGISKSKSSKLSINASMISWQFYNFKNATGFGRDFKSNNLTILPRAFSFLYKPKKVNGMYFELLTMLRSKVNFTLNESRSALSDVNSEIPGDEVVSTNYFLRTGYNDYYMGLGLGYNLGNNWSIGGSAFISIKSVFQQQRYNIAFFPTSDSFYYQGEAGESYTTSIDFNSTVSFDDISLLGKLGINYLSEDFSFGLVVTSPSVNFYGKGYSEKLVAIQNIRVDTLSGLTSVRVQDWQRGLSAHMKTPWSISMGVRFHSHNQRFQFTASIEYFFKINAYKMIVAEENPFITDPATYEQLPVKDFATYANAADDVFNVAFGMRYEVSEPVTLFGGFRTDFNARTDWDLGEFGNYSTLISSDYDLFHFTFGSTFRIKNSDLMMGVQ
jgi:hypothetical protein